MQHIQRLRLRLTRVALPTIVLGVASACYGFTVGRELDAQTAQLLFIGILIALFFLWLLPSLAYLGTYVDVYNDRIVLRAGLFGKRREIMRAEIREVTASAIRGVVITLNDDEVLHLKGYPKPRAIAELVSGTAK
jgi:hypothetical protein